LRILYISQYFPPEIGATQNRAYEMAKNLIRLGHEVTVLTEMPNHPSGVVPPEYRGKRFVREFYENIPVCRCWVYARENKTFRNRIAFYISFLLSAVFFGIFRVKNRFDTIYVTSPPLLVGLVGVALSTLWRIPFVFEVRDLWPESAVELNQLTKKKHIAVGNAIANLCYRRAIALVGVTRGIVEKLREKPEAMGRIELIKNGTNPDRFRFAHDAKLKKRLGWDEDFIVLYAGIHGLAQGLEYVLEAARELLDERRIRFVLIGEGPYRGQLIQSAREQNLVNTTFLDEIPGDQIGRYIALADVCLVPLRKKQLFKGALPSKIFDSWVCGKPIVLSVDGEAREEVEAANGGIYVEPENPRAMADAIRSLKTNRDLCARMGENGRRYLYSNGYIRSQQAEHLSRVIEEATGPRPVRTEPAPPKIRVLRIISRLNIGGPAIHVSLLSKHLDPDRYEQVLITGEIAPHEGDMSYLFDGAAVQPQRNAELQREIRVWKDFKTLLNILRVLRTVRPDIVHTHTAKAGAVGRLASLIYNLLSRHKVRCVHTFHGHVFHGYFSRSLSTLFVAIEKFFAAFTDRIVVLSESQRQDLEKKYRIAPHEKIELIRLGFDLSRFLESGTLKGRFRRRQGIDSETLLIGIVGRLTFVKNHLMFLKAAKALIERNPSRKMKFIVVGDGELRKPLEHYCEKYGLRGHVVFHGWSRNIEEVYADLDALALTSISEGTPVSIIEAMAASVPVISTSVGGTSDLMGRCRIDRFQIGRHGMLCRSGDVNGLVEGIEFLLSDASGRIAEMVFNAREYVIDHYSRNRMIHEIECLYDAIVSGKGRRRALRKRSCASRPERPPVAEGCFDN